MVKRHALIRKLPSVETLGCATVICSDKTGTLTKNEMTVQAVYSGGRFFEVTGSGYEPKGEILFENTAINPVDFPDLRQALSCSVLCNGSELTKTNAKYSIIGDPTEGALLVCAAKAGLVKSALEQEYTFVEEIPFDSVRKKMTLIRDHKGVLVVFVKGAPDVLL